jgi:hypothetical protein
VGAVQVAAVGGAGGFVSVGGLGAEGDVRAQHLGHGAVRWGKGIRLDQGAAMGQSDTSLRWVSIAATAVT